MKHYIIKDTLEAYLQVGEESYFYGLTTDASITRNMSQEMIKAGIGSKIVGTISEEEGFDISITTGLYYADTLGIQMGQKSTPVTDVEIQDVSEDAEGVVTAATKNVKGDAIEFIAGSTPKNAKLQLRTVAYDPDTNEIVADIFYIFDRVSPSGEFTHSFGMGTNNVQEIAFKTLIPKGSNSYGRYVIAPVPYVEGV